jgi:hypothetical protein
MSEFLVLDAVWGVRIRSQTLAPVYFVLLVISLEIYNLTLSFEGEDVGRDAIEEPSIVAYDHRTSTEVQHRFLEGSQGVHVEVVGWLVE